MRRKLIIAVGLMIGVFAAAATAQTDAVASNRANNIAPPQIAKPATTEIRGIVLGMTADDVKEKLGKPKVNDADGFYYVLSDNESLQIRLDEEGKVNIVSITYSGNDAKAPPIADVLGEGRVITPGPNGRIHEIVRYPDAGYWVSYSKIMLDRGPMISVTMQKIR